jgi:hypothetical protein
MTKKRTTLRVKCIVANAGSRLPVDDQGSLIRDVGLQLELPKESGMFVISAVGNLFDAKRTWSATLPISRNDVFRYVERCRTRWRELLVGHWEEAKCHGGGKEKRFLFEDEWNFQKKSRAWLDGFGAQLAVAGAQLFFHLFQERRGSDVLRRIMQYLRAGLQTRELTMTVTSNCFFVPWGMMYVHPDDNPPHNPEDIEIKNDIAPAADGKVPTSVNFDERIDKKLRVQCIVPQLDFLKNHFKLSVTPRRVKQELMEALMCPDLTDRIIYFCCHGTGSSDGDGVNLRPAEITLTDDNPISDADLSFWLDGRDLTSNPIVFINACQGGQLTTMFYATLATEFLRKKAVAVLGAQIDMPAVFACEFAQRFFESFLNGDSRNRVRMGPMLRDLTKKYIDIYKNPLGLAYSSYRGMDCFVGS